MTKKFKYWFFIRQNYSERATVRDSYLQYIGPLDKYLTNGFVGGLWEAVDQITHILRLGGQMYFQCGNIIYTKVTQTLKFLFCFILTMNRLLNVQGKVDCLLAQLNNVLLIPISFSDVNKELPAAAISPLQQYLPSVSELFYQFEYLTPKTFFEHVLLIRLLL